MTADHPYKTRRLVPTSARLQRAMERVDQVLTRHTQFVEVEELERPFPEVVQDAQVVGLTQVVLGDGEVKGLWTGSLAASL